MPYVDNVAIGTKRRRNVTKVSQDTSSVYSSDNSGKTYNTGDYTLSKTKGIDKLQGTKQEKRGRKKAGSDGNAKHKYKTTGQKQRQRSRSNKAKAKRGGK